MKHSGRAQRQREREMEGRGVQKGVLTKEAEAAVTILFATLRGKCHMACVCVSVRLQNQITSLKM